VAVFDRNQFLLLAAAIATAATVLAEEDQTGRACDDDTGRTGRAKYCPIAENGHHGCLTRRSCTGGPILKAASELRLYDCLANATDCSSGTAQSLCGQQLAPHACADTSAETACQTARRACPGPQGAMMRSSCATYLAPLTAAGRTQFTSCIAEGCDDGNFTMCLGYMGP
jgi:hypothetical protein